NRPGYLSAFTRLVELTAAGDNEREFGGNGKTDQAHVLFAVPLGEDGSVTGHERAFPGGSYQLPFPFDQTALETVGPDPDCAETTGLQELTVRAGMVRLACPTTPLLHQ